MRNVFGASYRRLARQFATESLLLVALDGLLGRGTAELGLHGLLRLLSRDMLASMPYLEGLGINLHVLVFAGAVCAVAAALFAAVPLVRMPGGEAVRAG